MKGQNHWSHLIDGFSPPMAWQLHYLYIHCVKPWLYLIQMNKAKQYDSVSMLKWQAMTSIYTKSTNAIIEGRIWSGPITLSCIFKKVKNPRVLVLLKELLDPGESKRLFRFLPYEKHVVRFIGNKIIFLTKYVYA